MKTRSYKLTDEEALLLDGKVRDDVQKLVTAARGRLAAVLDHPDLSPELAGFIADVVSEAEERGRLILRWEWVMWCPVCRNDAGYVLFKSGRRKGKPRKRRYLQAVELASRFVTVKGSVALGCCSECLAAVEPALVSALASARAEIPKRFVAEGRPDWRRWELRRCKGCGWEGHEGEMRELPALMGGRYRGGCPACPAENRPLGPTRIERRDGFVVVEAS